MLNTYLIIRWLILLLDNHFIWLNLSFCLYTNFAHFFLWIVWFWVAYFVVNWYFLLYYCHFFFYTVTFFQVVYFFLVFIAFDIAFILKVQIILSQRLQGLVSCLMGFTWVLAFRRSVRLNWKIRFLLMLTPNRLYALFFQTLFTCFLLLIIFIYFILI